MLPVVIVIVRHRLWEKWTVSGMRMYLIWTLLYLESGLQVYLLLVEGYSVIELGLSSSSGKVDRWYLA